MAKILIIDDDRRICGYLAEIMTASGHVARTALDGTQGGVVARDFRPDVVFVDLLMPGRAGLETIVELRAELPEAKIIAMTGQPMIGNVSLLDIAKRFGADTFLAKPFTLAQVVELLNVTVGN